MLLISEEASNVLVLGALNCANTLRLREFLGRNGYLYKFIDLDTDERTQSILDHFQVKVEEVPVVICNARSVLRNPSIRELADCLGLNVSIDESQVRDLIVVGAGPSGVAAAVYAASEGLKVVETGTPLPTRSIVLAADAQYNKPPIPELSQFESNGVYYGATAMESQLCVGEDVVVVA